MINQALSVRFNICAEQGDFAGAAKALAELAPRWKRMMPAGHIAFATLSHYEALLDSARGDHRTAVAKADRGIALAEANSQGLDYLPIFLIRRADVNLKAGRLEQARADADRAIAMEQKAVAPGSLSSTIGRAYLMLSRALRAQNDFEAARAAGASAVRHLQPAVGANHPKAREARRLASPEAASPAANRR